MINISKLINDIEYDNAFKENANYKNLKQKAIDLCELPRNGLSATLNMKKKANEIRYINSPSRLSYLACALLTNQSRMVKQSLLEMEDLGKRI